MRKLKRLVRALASRHLISMTGTTRQLRLSVLDQTPVPSGATPAQAIENSIDLAREVDRLGYTRLWYSEHHAMDLLACTAPEILIARAGAATEHIRLGSGGVMLPHYAPLKVAEVFRTLEAMYPGRIDLGVGRAPGGGQLEAYALRRQRGDVVAGSRGADEFPQQLGELRAFLQPERFEADSPDHPFRRIRVMPSGPGMPDVWLLGSSMWSAVTAAQAGLPYAYAHFFSAEGTRRAVEYYQRNFQPDPFSPGRQIPEATLAIGVICAPTTEEAEWLALSGKLLQRRIRTDDRRPVAPPDEAERELAARPAAPNPLLAFTAGSFDQPENTEWPRYLVGTPENVARRLRGMAEDLQLDEILVNTITHSHAARVRSYRLLAEAMALEAGVQQEAA